jgi:CheY-like chemotaxis protein
VIVSLHDLLQRTIRANIEIRTQLCARQPQVLADRGQMEQILVNLAVNAQDAIADGGHILVETADVELDPEQVRLLPGLKPGAHVLLSFSDNGCGMPPEVLERIFEPFYTTKPAGSGTGLGLATVYGIVKQHGGHIKAVSRLGQGTSLLVYLPKAGEEAPAAAAEFTDLPEEPKDGAGRVVLVVDDNDLVREMAREVLQSAGFRVLAAESSLEARRLAESSALAIELLVTDVVMPGMSGPQLYESLVGRFPRLPVLYISGHTFDLKLHGSVTDGMVHFLPKPFTTDQLLNGVQQALN